MAQQRQQQRRAAQLRPQLLVAAGRAQDDLRAGADAAVHRVVGGDVAGVQRDHHVDRPRREAAHVAELEGQAAAGLVLQAEAARGAVAELDHVGLQVDAGHPGLAAQRLGQVGMDREGQVALAGAEVQHLQRRLAGPAALGQRRRAGERMVEDLDELVDLLPFARHRGHELVRGVGDAERGEPGRGGVDQAALGAVVGRRHGRNRGGIVGRRRGRAAAPQRRLALAADRQLQAAAVVGDQVEVVEAFVQQGRERGQPFLDRQVARHVAAAVMVGQRQAGAALEDDRPGQHAQQVRLGPARAGEHQLDAAAGLQRGARLVEEACARVGGERGRGSVGHGAIVGATAPRPGGGRGWGTSLAQDRGGVASAPGR